MILDTIAGSQYSYSAGTSGTVTVAAGLYVTGVSAHASGASATITITPGGPKQVATAGSAIPVPPVGWWSRNFYGQLGPGTVIVFTSTDSYYVEYAKFV